MVNIAFGLAALLISLLFTCGFAYVKIHPEKPLRKRRVNSKGQTIFEPISVTKPLLISVSITALITVYMVFAIRGVKRSNLGDLSVVTGLVLTIFIVIAIYAYYRESDRRTKKVKAKKKNGWTI